MASFFRLLSRATTKLQAVFKKQYIFNKHNTYLQEFVYKGPFKTSIFPVEELGRNCLSVELTHERDRYTRTRQNMSLFGLLTAGVFSLALTNHTVEVGGNDETPEAKNCTASFRKKGKFSTKESTQTRTEKLQKMNAGLAKRKLSFENLDDSTEEQGICKKKRMTRSMEVKIYTVNH
jgi:hypothetical protein